VSPLQRLVIERSFAFPRRDSPESLKTFPSVTEGAGNAGCALHPRSRVQNCAKKRTRAYRFSGGNPAFPARLVLTAYAALSPATNSSCHRHRRIGDLAEPGWANENLRRLDTSNGCQDHTVLPSADTFAKRSCRTVHARQNIFEGGFSAVRPRARRSLTVLKPPCEPKRAGAAASTASHPNVRDDRDTSLMRDGMRLCSADLGSAKTGLFLRGALDRAHA
jgi:hypothetical protein